MKHNIFIYILIMSAVSFVIRDVPFTFFRKQIKSRFVRSFLYYVPYVTLSVMPFSSVIEVTGTVWAGLAAFAAGIVCAWFGLGLFKVSLVCCGCELLSEVLGPLL